MEDGFGEKATGEYEATVIVLILILMEDGFGG